MTFWVKSMEWVPDGPDNHSLMEYDGTEFAKSECHHRPYQQMQPVRHEVMLAKDGAHQVPGLGEEFD